MNKKKQEKMTPDEFLRTVKCQFNQQRPSHAYAVEKFEQQMREAREDPRRSEGEVTDSFEKPEVIRAAAHLSKALINKYLAEYNLRQAGTDVMHAATGLERALGKHQGVFPEDGQILALERLGIIRPRPAADDNGIGFAARRPPGDQREDRKV